MRSLSKTFRVLLTFNKGNLNSIIQLTDVSTFSHRCHNASVNSSCAHPPPGNCGAFAHLVSPGGGALANLAWPGSRAFAYPGATPGVLTHLWFPTRNPNMEDFIAKDQQFVADWIDRHGLDKLVEVFSILCISSLVIRHNLSYHYI